MVNAEQGQKADGLESKLWDYRVSENNIETVPEDKLKELISSGQLGAHTQVRRSGTEEWIKASGAKVLMPDLDQKPHPWERLFARLFDLLIYGFFLAIIFIAIHFDLLSYGTGTALCLSSMIVVCTWIIPETFLMATYGTTPGKWVFNIKVRTSSGDKLSFGESLERSIGVATRGLALGLPLVYLITLAMSHDKLTNGGKTSWDRSGAFVVSHGKIGPIRILAITVLFCLYILSRLLPVFWI